MIKKTASFFRNIPSLPFIPKSRHHGSIFVLAGLIFIVLGFALQGRHVFQKEMQYRYYLSRVMMSNNLNRYNPADVVESIPYIDSTGMRSGTITVLDQGTKKASCGTRTTGPCSFYWNVSAHKGDTRLTPHLLLMRGFGENEFSSIKLLDPATFEIVTIGGAGDCKNTTSYIVKITGTSGWITAKQVEEKCYNSKGAVYSTEKYSTTTIDSAF